MIGARRHRQPSGRVRRGRRGFSLMEMVVALGIFSTVVVAASDIFTMSSVSQRKIFALEASQANARFIMEAMAREIRTGAIDYVYYADQLGFPDEVTGAVDRLALIDSAGSSILFQQSDVNTNDACPDELSMPCFLVSVDNGPPASITPQGVIARNVRFYVNPKADPVLFDPATGQYAASTQPNVTVVMVLESGTADPRARTLFYIQTTVASRAYLR